MSSSLASRAIFAESGHFTAMHNALFDWVQPRLSLSAWSVLCVIVRRTRGWDKKYDAISYKQIKAATGIKSTATISKALNELLSEFPFGKPLLRRQKSNERAASCREATRYALNPRFEIEVSRQRPEASVSRGEGEWREEENSDLSFQGLTVGDVSPPLESLEIRASVFEEPEAVHPSSFEAPEAVRPSEIEDTKETPISYRVENSKCEYARTNSTPPPAQLNHLTTHQPDHPALLAAVGAATLRDPAIVSAKMRSQLVACARTLERAGYRAEHIELAAQRWPHPTAPYPSQLLDNIQSLLNARPASQSRRAKSSNPAAIPAPSDRRVSAGNLPGRPRFECAADRKSRKWADWLSELGGV
ncbi:hypothetical protein IAD21_00624 [Abditibacteriota bacterium]|nr:hypothetical protein IAD21_00624 [Abditibacteriota bacterium]